MRSQRPIVFLDIDDVVCLGSGGIDCTQYFRGRRKEADTPFATMLSPESVDALRQIHRGLAGEVCYVISSSWREAMTREQLQTALQRGGLEFVATNMLEEQRWATPTATDPRHGRVDEILTWMERHHKGQPWVILDDSLSGGELVAIAVDARIAWRHRIVLCEPNVGLRVEHVGPTIAALKATVHPSEDLRARAWLD
jgi:hypothetical protein